jgi:hypothetical protein
MCWNKHGEEGLNELEAGCLNEGEVRHHANHDKDLDDSAIFEGNEPLFPPNVLRPEDITDQEVRGFDDGEVLQRVHNVDQMLRDIFFSENTVGEFPTAQLNKKEFMYKQEHEGRAGRREATKTLRDTLQKRNKRSLPITLHSHDMKKTLSLKLPNPNGKRS